MTRIIGGTGKGRRLRTPRGEATRPTGARVRQTLFDILAPRMPGCRFLDAFAGNGGVGLEALSRGARMSKRVWRTRAPVGRVASPRGVRSLRPLPVPPMMRVTAPPCAS